MSIKILIADDHEVVRSGLKSLLSGPDIDVVAQASGGEEAFRQTMKSEPNVVLLDIRMADGDGLDALDKIRTARPSTRVIMLSTFDNPTYMARAAALGASDYLLKSASREELRAAIKAAAAGESPLRTELRRLAGSPEAAQVELKDDVSLTQRESQVLRHMALGLSNKEIGRALGISVDTVKEHVQNILRKVEATDRTQAAVWAVRKGLV
jgi:DNA-binding NarL/FixJ family response regulator